MIKHISFPSIGRFRNVVSDIKRIYEYVGRDENGDTIYDETKEKPVLKFQGTTKIHGGNFSVCYNDIDDMWCQSRNEIISVEDDKFGFAFFVNQNKEIFRLFMEQINGKYWDSNHWLSNNTISIFVEWAGKGIQKGVAISEIEKSAFIIGVKITPQHEDTEEYRKTNPAYWVDFDYLRATEARIYNILDYTTYELEVDFNHPENSIDKINELTLQVEEECPVSKAFNISGTGEGICWTFKKEDGSVIRWKSKGEKHAKSKAPKLDSVDDEKLNKIIELANEVTPAWRLQQAYQLIFGNNFDNKKIGDFIRAVMQDIIKEESDLIAEAGLEPKDIGGKVAEISRKYLFENV